MKGFGILYYNNSEVKYKGNYEEDRRDGILHYIKVFWTFKNFYWIYKN